MTGGAESLTAANLTGAVWCRRNGAPSASHGPGALSRSGGQRKLRLSNITPDYNGYSLSATSSVASDQVNVTLNFTNWYFRWLGLYIQFYDSNGNVVPTTQVPQGISDLPGLDTAWASIRRMAPW